MLSIQAPINNTGYGISSYYISSHIGYQQANSSLIPIGDLYFEPQWDRTIISNMISNVVSMDKNDHSLKIWHSHDLITAAKCQGLYGCYTFFELDQISPYEHIGYSLVDKIIVPTRWAKEILTNNNICSSKIHVVNPGVDTQIFKPIELPEKYNQDSYKEKYIFINIGKWEVRKGHDILAYAFNKAFDKKDNVELWMINHNSGLSLQQRQQWKSIYRNTKLSDKIRIFPRLSTQLDVSLMLNRASCAIFPSRAEGWNNEAIEAMATNKPVILSDYSAHTEYANDTNSFLIPVINKEIAEDGIFFSDTQAQWAKLDNNFIDSLIDTMRYVYKNNIHQNQEGLLLTSNMSWQATAKEIIKIYE